MLVAGALVTEIVFAYPGLGHLILQAIQNQDFFLLQGTFLFIVIGVLVANFVIDIVYVLVDPRTRTGMQGSRHDRGASAKTGAGGDRPQPPHGGGAAESGAPGRRCTSRCATRR